MKKKNTQLKLSRETLRNLATQEVEVARGADQTDITCPSVCENTCGPATEGCTSY